MGEVRVRARLANAVDEALARRGAIKPEEARRHEADALVDAGAVRSVVPPHVAGRLGLALRGQRVAEYADGRKEAAGVTEPLVITARHLPPLILPQTLPARSFSQTIASTAATPALYKPGEAAP